MAKHSFSAKSPLVVVVIAAIAFCSLPLFGAIGFSPLQPGEIQFCSLDSDGDSDDLEMDGGPIVYYVPQTLKLLAGWTKTLTLGTSNPLLPSEVRRTREEIGIVNKSREEFEEYYLKLFPQYETFAAKYLHGGKPRIDKRTYLEKLHSPALAINYYLLDNYFVHVYGKGTDDPEFGTDADEPDKYTEPNFFLGLMTREALYLELPQALENSFGQRLCKMQLNSTPSEKRGSFEGRVVREANVTAPKHYRYIFTLENVKPGRLVAHFRYPGFDDIPWLMELENFYHKTEEDAKKWGFYPRGWLSTLVVILNWLDLFLIHEPTADASCKHLILNLLGRIFLYLKMDSEGKFDAQYAYVHVFINEPWKSMNLPFIAE